jgi:NTE family protein
MKFLLALSFLLFIFLASAQVQPSYPVKKAEGRPTIGLCLSGGGAKGFAHIGVLKIIDSLGIPIDYVTGTSMGSIMGGLYAIGYTGKQIEASVLETDWLDLMNSTPERQYQSFSTKDFASRNLFTVGLDGFKIVLPAGLNNASKVFQKLHNVTIGYHGQQNFLDFPRGFICIGADLNTGEEIAFTEGSLPDAMRASMAIPSMFTPHQIDGRTLVDGGTLNNFPTDKLVELGCDIIIGVDLQSPPTDSASVTLTEVLEKTAMFINRRVYEESIERCDIYIHPDLKGFSGGDFDQAEPIIACGKSGGQEQMAQLVALAHKLQGTPKQKIPPYAKPDSIVISDIEVIGLKRVSKSYVLGVIDYDGGSKAIEDLEVSMNAMYGSQYFTQVNYDLLQEDSGLYKVQVHVNENDNDLDVGVGLRYDPDFETSVLINFATRNWLIKGSRFNFDVVISENPRFRLLYEVDRGFKPGFGIRSNFYFTKPSLRDANGALLGNYAYDDWTTGVYAVFSANNKGVFRIGGEFNYAYINVRDVPVLRDFLDPNDNDPGATVLNLDHLNFFGELKIDVMDDFNYPNKGHYFSLEGRYHSGVASDVSGAFEDHFITLFGQYRAAYSPSKWMTILPELTVGWSFLNDPGATYSYAFHLGGLGRNYFHYQIPFLGYHYQQMIQLSNISKAGLAFRFNPFRKHYISAMINYALWFDLYDTGLFYDRGKPTNYPIVGDAYDFAGWGLRYGINSFLGPIEITAHRSFDQGGWLVYFNLGYWF